MDQFEADLTCPITGSLLEDPINVTCCGKSVSRMALLEWFDNRRPEKKCPVCRGDLSAFNAVNAIKNINVAGLVETFQNGGQVARPVRPVAEVIPVKTQTWSATMNRLYDHTGKPLQVAELKLNLENSMFATKPTLVLIILDVSGSMSGTGIKQCKEALTHIMAMTCTNPFVKTVLMTYESVAKLIDVSGPIDRVKATIAGLQAGGGNNEEAAFKLAGEVLKKYKYCEDGSSNDDNTVSSVSIIFLTDGQACRDRKELIIILQQVVHDNWINLWTGSLCIHTVGFTSSCDTAFLEDVRKQGTIEGSYRYADPTDIDDTLCRKLQSLFDNISESSRVKITVSLNGVTFKTGGTISEIQFPVNKDKSGSYSCWITADEIKEFTVTIKSIIDDNINVPVAVVKTTDRNQKLLLDRWISALVDEMANELIELNTQQKFGSPVFDLHCALLQQRVDALRSCTGSPDILSRIDFIGGQVDSLREGKGISVNRLGDMRFGSQFGGLIAAPVAHVPLAINQPILKQIANQPAWVERSVHYSRNNSGKQRNRLQEEIMNTNFNKTSHLTKQLISESTLQDILHADINGNNSLHIAAFCGHSETTALLVKKYPMLNLEIMNNDKETAVTLAIKKRGFHKTVGCLLDAGAKIPDGRTKSLEEFAINAKLTITAQILSNIGDGDSDVNMSMTPEYIKYLYSRSDGKSINTESYLKVAVNKGMIQLVKELIDKHNAVPTIDNLLACIPNKPDDPDFQKYIDLAAILLHKTPELINQVDKETGESAVFRSAESGNLPNLKYFLSKGGEVDRQNSAGNSPLWVACAKRWPCIIDELLNNKADVNLVNLKGNPPMYNLCQRGPKKICETLLARGAKVDHINNNGDTLVLLCCRNNQPEILELFLNYVDEEFVDFKAHIDGFNAIFASVEKDSADCIRVLHQYGVSLVQMTDNDNPILPGATPMHLAAYYGRTAALNTLLALSCSPNVLDINGATPMHIAVIQGHLDCIKSLRNAGSNLTIKDKAGNTPAAYCRGKIAIRKVLVNPALDVLMMLAKGGMIKGDEKECCKVLRQHAGAIGCLSSRNAVDLIDHDGMTPLLKAIIHSNYVVVSTLIELGADPNIETTIGVSGHVFGRWIDNPRIVALLQNNNNNVLKVNESLGKLNKASAADVNNKQLLFLGAKPTIVSVQVSSSGIKERMESFINCLNTVPVLQIEYKLGQTIAGILEYKDLENNEVTWSAKIHTVSLIASGKAGDILTAGVAALCLFTNNSILPIVVNNVMLTGQFGANIIKEYIGCLLNSLDKLDTYCGEVYIGATTVDRKLFQVNSNIKWNHFVSTTSLWRVATEYLDNFDSGKKQGTVFIIKSKTGKYLGPYSQFSFDSEVIFRPGTTFKVTNWYHGSNICLGQENIRVHSFTVKPDEIDKMMNSDKSLVIQLEEL